MPPFRPYRVAEAPKVGFIFECAEEGPDMWVCRRFLELLRPRLQMEPVGLSNKRNLRIGCGKAARRLLDEGCQRIVILWDLQPACWEDNEEKASIYTDIRKIRRSLRQHQVSLERIVLICQLQMLEAWLLADRRALRTVLERIQGRGLRRHLNRFHDVETIPDPKETLEHLFEEHLGKGNYYRDHIHAHKIATALPDTQFLAHSWTFRRFVTKAARVPLR